jgi:alpha-beta hydrolase superfamily lysophospholipase
MIQNKKWLANFKVLKIVRFSCFSFSDLVTMVEDIVRKEHATSPNKPIYLLGNSFGGCLALAVASRNPHIDLILVLVNPGIF